MDSVGEKAMYQDAMTKTRVERGKGFQCQSGGASGLSPQLAAFRPCAGGVVERVQSAELLNADDLVLVAETIQGIAARKVRK